MTLLRSTLAPALLLGAGLAAASCSEVLVAPGVAGATASGAGGEASSSTTSSSAGSGGQGAGGSNTRGAGGAMPVDLPWQTTAAGDVYGIQVAADASGNVIVAGLFGGMLDVGGSTLTGGKFGSMFVAKLDHAGQYLWVRGFDNVSGAIGLAVDGLGDVLVTGAFRETTDFGGGPLTSAKGADVFVAKLDPGGAHLYSHAYGDPDYFDWQHGGAIAVDAAGNAYVTGSFRGTLDFGGGPLENLDGDTDLFVIKLDPAGQHVWSRRFGGELNQSAGRIAVSPGGRIAVTGIYQGSPDLGGGPLPDYPSNLLDSSFLLELDPAGNHVFSGGYNCHHTGPAFDDAGNLTFAGAFTGDVDFGAGPLSSGYFVHVVTARFAAGASLSWDESFGEVGATVYDVSVTPAGGGSILLAGYGTGGIDFGGGSLLLGGEHLGGFLARLDVAGAHMWSRGFGGEGDFQGVSAAVAPDGDVFFAGTFTGTIELPEGAATSQGKRDLFLLKLAP